MNFNVNNKFYDFASVSIKKLLGVTTIFSFNTKADY